VIVTFKFRPQRKLADAALITSHRLLLLNLVLQQQHFKLGDLDKHWVAADKTLKGYGGKSVCFGGDSAPRCGMARRTRTRWLKIARTMQYRPSGAGFNGSFSLSLQPLTQSLLSYQPASAYADCGQVFMLNRVVEEPKRKASHLSGLPRSIRHSR
jgi:hypothetical protein